MAYALLYSLEDVSGYIIINNNSMKHFFKQLIYGGVVLAPAFLLTGCITDEYSDLDNIDLTVGLGSDGLGVKLGNADILLKDILSVDENVKTDDNSLYYLVESGSTDFDVKIKPLTVDLGIPELEMNVPVLEYDNVYEQFIENVVNQIPGVPHPSYGDDIHVMQEYMFMPMGMAQSDKQSTDFKVEGISDDVNKINWVTFDPQVVTISVEEDKSRPEVKFGIEEVSNVKITLPKEIRVVDCDDNWSFEKVGDKYVLTPNPGAQFKPDSHGKIDICDVTVGGSDVNEEIEHGQDLHIQRQIVMEGKVDFHVTDDFVMEKNDYMSIKLAFSHPEKIDIREVNGRFDPEVDVTDFDPINVFDDLPDFLQDRDVKVSVTNPTLKFSADLTDVPVAFDFGATLSSVKNGENGFNRPVVLPSLTAMEHQVNTLYYYQDKVKGPYDPNVAKPAFDAKGYVENLSDLIKELPDHIDVNLRDKQIRMHQNDYTLEMGHNYKAKASYDIYVPFEFDKDLTIVYRDTTDSFGSDLEDYAAHGVSISAKVKNSIPLSLNLTLVALDAQGEELTTVDFPKNVKVKAGTGDNAHPVEDELVLEAKLANPNDLKEIDRLTFLVTADGAEAGGQLVSNQFLRLDDIRVRLKGQVIADFN